MRKLSLIRAAALLVGLACTCACGGSTETAPSPSTGGSGGTSSQDGGGSGGDSSVGGTGGNVPMDGCPGLGCFPNCGDAGIAVDDNGCATCSCNPQPDGGDCDPKLEPGCIGSACVNGAWVCPSSCEEGFCRAAVMSSCGTADAIPVPSWSCDVDAGTPGYCCMPISTCGSDGYCTQDPGCHDGFVLTQMGCDLGDGGSLGSCCKLK